MQMKQTKSVENPNSDLVSRFRPHILALVLVLVCLAAHTISFWNSFILNDHFDIPGFRSVPDKEWPQYWTELVTQAMIKPFAEPLLKASLCLDFQSAGLMPALYHATNVLLHIAAVLSAFFLLRRLVKHFEKAQAPGQGAGNGLVPFIACLLFAAHPLTCESVAYISGRSAILTFLWYTLALHAFLTGFAILSVRDGLFGYLFCYISVVLSLFSSCQAITIPETMIVVGLLVKPATERFKDWIYERQAEFRIAFFTAIVLPLTFLLPQIMPVGNGLGLPLLSNQAYYATQLKALFTYYLRVFLVPVPLSFAPPYCLAQSLADPLALAGLAVLAGFIYLFYRLRRDPFCCLGIWLFLIGLVPQALIVTNEYVSDRRFYLSCFGLCLLVARLFVNFVGKKTNLTSDKEIAFEPRLVGPLLLTTLVLIGLSNYRDRSFATDSALLRGALRANLFDKSIDKDGRVRALLSLMLVLDGGPNVDKGLVEAKRALEINRNLPLAYLAMAKQATYRGDFDGAKYYSEKTLELAREQKLSGEVMGVADGCLLIALTQLDQFQDPQKLKDLAKEALLVDPANAKLYLALARTYLSEHKPESGAEALAQLKIGRNLDPNDVNFTAPIVEADLATGSPRDFEQAYGAACLLHRINPTDGSRLLVARASLETGRLAKGFGMMEEILTRQKGRLDAEGAIILSGLYKQQGRTAKSEEYLDNAKKLDPKIESKIHLWLRVKPLTPIEEAREKAAEEGHPIQEKHKRRIESR
jgi:tetratricopeptide (TPR) repeat protein